MSDKNAAQGEEEIKDTRKSAFSDQLEEMEDALNVLFIRNNASGRNKFRDRWPELALYLFGAELIDFDDNGTTDRGRRSQLEEDADRRRIELKAAALEIPEKSVRSGMLEFEYVGGILDKFGSVISRYFYSEEVIERVRPGLLSAASEVEGLSQEEIDRDVVDSDPQLREQEKEILRNAPVDDLEDVRPIETVEVRVEQEMVQPPSVPEENNDFAIPETIPESTDLPPQEPVQQDVPMKEELPPPVQPPSQMDVTEAVPIQTETPQPVSEPSPVVTAPTVPKGTYVSIFNACALKKAA